jgi:hypothetical protein
VVVSHVVIQIIGATQIRLQCCSPVLPKIPLCPLCTGGAIRNKSYSMFLIFKLPETLECILTGRTETFR